MPDPEILPPDKSALAEPRVTINQFIQLVNKNNILPSGQELAQYSTEDREWIKSRVVVEQEARNVFLQQLLANDHEMNVIAADHRTHRMKHSQMWAGIIILTLIAVGALLIYLGQGLFAIGLVAVVMFPPIASSISEQIRCHLLRSSKETTEKQDSK